MTKVEAFIRPQRLHPPPWPPRAQRRVVPQSQSHLRVTMPPAPSPMRDRPKHKPENSQKVHPKPSPLPNLRMSPKCAHRWKSRRTLRP